MSLASAPFLIQFSASLKIERRVCGDWHTVSIEETLYGEAPLHRGKRETRSHCAYYHREERGLEAPDDFV